MEFLQKHWTNEEGQPYELFVGIPWSKYLNEISLDETYVRVILSLGPQATIDINPGNTQQQILVLVHYAEGQGNHYVCVRQNKLTETTGKNYDQESKTDEDANLDPENLHPEIKDLGDDGIDDGKDEITAMICIIMSQRIETIKNVRGQLPAANYYHKAFHLGCCSSPRSASGIIICCLVWSTRKMSVHNRKLTVEIWFKIIRNVLHQCDFDSLENHVCFVLTNLKLVIHHFFSLASKNLEDLPRIYVNNPELLPKPKRGKYVVSIMGLIKKFGSFSGIVFDIKHMLNFSGWNSTWLVLLPCTYSWFIILNFFWKKRKQFS